MIELKLKPAAPISMKQIGGDLIFTIPPEGGEIHVEGLPCLDKMKHIVMDVTARSDMQLPVALNFYKEVSSDPQIRVTTSTIPGIRAVMSIDLGWLDSSSVFKPRTPGKLKTVVVGAAMEVSEVSKITLRFRNYHMAAEYVVHKIYLSSEPPETGIREPKKIVDRFGQVSVRDWPGKTKEFYEMKERLTALRDAAKKSVAEGKAFPARFGYSKWGGDFGNKLSAGTGFFSVKKQGDTWHLADPDGYAFFSVGLDCVGTNTGGAITGIEELFCELPDRGEFADAYSVSGGRHGVSVEYLDFYRANMIRVFGGEWFEAYCEITEHLMMEMGFNTIGNWSDEEFIKKSSLPYVLPLAGFPATERSIFRDMPDVFSAEYEKSSESYAAQLKEFAGDRRLIGYFMRNEPEWGFSEDINLALEMFRSDYPFESKRALWADLMKKYKDAKTLSNAWGVAMGCEKCLMGLTLDDLKGETCLSDLREFSKRLVERYVDVPAKALRKVDRNHLNLGMRYAYISSESMFEGCGEIDVFSINCYHYEPRREVIEKIMDKCGKPCVIGEYHHGANDRGGFGNSLYGVANAFERGVAYRYYAEQGAAIPQLLGCHYFCIGDEASLGRFDGESWNIGFIDVCHRPYEEMFDAAVKTHERLYAVRTGKVAPFATQAISAPTNSY